MKDEKADEIASAAIMSMQEIARIAARQIEGNEEAGSTMIALLISAYADLINDYVHDGFMTLDDALIGTTKDLQIIQLKLKETYGS